MRRPKCRPLGLETLEDRALPAASLFFSAGGLTVRGDNTPNNLVMTQTGAGDLQVSVNGANLGTFAVTGNLTVLMGNGNDTVALATAAGPGLAGNLSVSTGNGNDSIDLGGAFAGNVMLAAGLGNDSVTATGGDVTVGGSLTSSDAAGVNTFNLSGSNATIGSNLILSGVGTFSMGGGNTLNVGGTALISAAQTAATPLTVLFDGTAATVGQGLQITGGALDDVVSVTSMLSVGGSMGLRLGAGNNTFVLTPAAGGFGAGGGLSYIGANGVDVVVLGSDSLVSGNTSISLGDGINTFVDTATSLYAGDLSVTGGNSTNTVVMTGIVAGNFAVTVGNGAGNTTVFTGSAGGLLRYRSGSGTLGVLTLAPAVAAALTVDVTFGPGDSTFTLGPNVTLGGVVRGTGGSYTFNQGAAVLGPTLMFINFP
jgi:hypothetical protein